MALTSRQKRNVKKLASSGNKAAQAYVSGGGKINRNTQVTDNKGRSLSLRRDSSGKAVGLQRDATITAESLKPAPKIPTAVPAPIDGMFGITNAANAGLAALNGGTYDTKTNQIVPAPAPTEAPVDNNQAILSSYLQANAGLEAPSAVNNLKEMQKTLRPKENLVNSLSGQLNTLNASRDAAMLSLEGQGRGQTQGFIGGEQARINREAAIQAMPIQAQLAIAQDDLESARTFAGQYFQAKMQDETNIYNQKKENNRLVFDFLNAAEARRLAVNEKALDREYAERQAATSNAQNIALQAIEYGQSSLAGRIMGFDPKSPTYAQDVRNAMAQLRKPVAAAGRQAPTTQTVDGKLYQYDYDTGTWKLAIGAGGTPDGSSPETESLLGIKQVLDGLTDAGGFSSAVGFGFRKSIVGAIPFIKGDALAGSARADFEAQATRLSDMFLVQNLDKMTGVLTDRDLEVLRNEGTTIGNFKQSESAWLKEKARLDAMVQRGLAQHGMTAEQAVHYGYMEPEDVYKLDEMWNTNTSTPAINFNYGN